MAGEKKRKGGGAKLARTETVTVRLDEKLRYLAELAARKQRRTLSSFIEWAVQDSLERVMLRAATSGDAARTVASEAAHLWDVDEAARFVKLATHYPELLTYEEQLQLNLLISQFVWDYRRDAETSARDPAVNSSDLRDRIEMVRSIWQNIRAMSPQELLQGELPPTVAPVSAIAEAVRQDYLKKSAAAEQLRLLQAQREPDGPTDL